ncbi:MULTISPECIES: sigma-70 family RNA polymerase sigma factor [Sphingobacteriaceae]|uniref:RNA polymerase, sigma-24 subunit, ECF subfamily n=1 Tax=Sphingobacterium sp. (strain 21) TaxID=743722 RepID=F4CCK9_SPHS2
MQPVLETCEKALIESMRNDDAAAFEQLFERYWEHLYQRAYYRLRSRELAEDLVQDVFADFWIQRHNLQIQSDLGGYLGAMLKYKIIRWASQQEREEELHAHLFQRMEEIEDGVISLLEVASLQQTINEAVRAFPENMRSVFLLRMQDYTIGEIAEVLQLADQTIRNNHTEALRRLKTKLIESHPHLPIYSLLTILFTKT